MVGHAVICTTKIVTPGGPKPQTDRRIDKAQLKFKLSSLWGRKTTIRFLFFFKSLPSPPF